MTARHRVYLLLLLWHAGASLLAQPSSDLDRQLAREPAVVTTTAGRTVRGVLDGVSQGRLGLRLATDGGEVGYSFSREEIAAVTWPGADLESDALELLDRGDLAQAVPLLEALARQRLRYIAFLDTDRQRVLWLLAERGAPLADPDRLLGVIRALAPQAVSPEKRLLLLEAELMLALRRGSASEIEALAVRWCAVADPEGRSALGWRIRARLAYDAGDDESARWLALQPVTFATRAGMEELASCYALAIAAADRAGDGAHALVLYQEMQSRRIDWPDDPAFAALALHYGAGSAAGAALRPLAPATQPPASPDPAVPRDLDALRKISFPPTTSLP